MLHTIAMFNEPQRAQSDFHLQKMIQNLSSEMKNISVPPSTSGQRLVGFEITLLCQRNIDVKLVNAFFEKMQEVWGEQSLGYSWV